MEIEYGQFCQKKKTFVSSITVHIHWNRVLAILTKHFVRILNLIIMLVRQHVSRC